MKFFKVYSMMTNEQIHEEAKRLIARFESSQTPKERLAYFDEILRCIKALRTRLYLHGVVDNVLLKLKTFIP